MSCFLGSHGRKYHLNSDDLFLSLKGGMSGLPYALRHWELSNKSAYACGHRFIAIVQGIPIVGILAAVIERIAYFVKEHVLNKPDLPALPTPFKHREPGKIVDLNVAMKKMLKNSRKAWHEHVKEVMSNKYLRVASTITWLSPAIFWLVAKFTCFAPLSEISTIETIRAHKSTEPLKLTHSETAEKGPRSSMEDFHFFKETEDAVITGVFDGHGGQDAAWYANQEIEKRFFAKLTQLNGNIHQTFELLVEEIHTDNDTRYYPGGSTMVLCYIDKRSHMIYTATLGDSEANIYRKMGRTLKSIPLSCVRDWGSEKDMQRVAVFTNDPTILLEWPKQHPKNLRYPFYGLNVSRAIRDLQFGFPMIHKPKITMHQLKRGDTLTLACDGLKDFLFEEQIIEEVEKGAEKLSERLVSSAIQKMPNTRDCDNVTVIAVSVA